MLFRFPIVNRRLQMMCSAGTAYIQCNLMLNLLIIYDLAAGDEYCNTWIGDDSLSEGTFVLHPRRKDKCREIKVFMYVLCGLIQELTAISVSITPLQTCTRMTRTGTCMTLGYIYFAKVVILLLLIFSSRTLTGSQISAMAFTERHFWSSLVSFRSYS